MEHEFPEEINNFVDNLKYSVDTIGRSGDAVYIIIIIITF